MSADRLKISARPPLKDPRMIIGLAGWMNGGEVSLGPLNYLAGTLRAARLAEIEPAGFYIYNLPGSMEVSALFRPHAVIEEGLVKACEPPANLFHADEANNLVLFRGKEPHCNWEDYADCLFAVASEFGVRRLYFIGSYAGVVPHTRAPRLYCSVSEEPLKREMEPHGLRFSSYEGPAGISTFLTKLAPSRGVEMVTIVAEIPAYVQGENPRCIEAVTRRLAAILGLQVSLDALRALADGFEAKVSEAVRERPELAEMVRKMEAEYDSEVFETQMGDLKQWLQQQGIRLD